MGVNPTLDSSRDPRLRWALVLYGAMPVVLGEPVAGMLRVKSIEAWTVVLDGRR